MGQGHQSGHQKADHGGKFCTVPHRVLDSPAWKDLSMRARAALQVFQMRHNGRNNGKIAMGVKALSAALGGKNHKAAGDVIRELIEHGFLECTSEANRSLARVREYRITFISSGGDNSTKRATHDYAEWRAAPGAERKFRGTKIAPREGESVTLNAPKRKLSVTLNAPCSTVSRGLEQSCRGAINAPHILNHLPDSLPGPATLQIVTSNVDQTHAGPSLDELRDWFRAVIAQSGYGGARKLSEATGIPEPILSRFRGGRNLPAHYRSALHTACARALPHSKFKAGQAAAEIAA